MNCNVFYTDDDLEDQQTFIDAINEISHETQVFTFQNGSDMLMLLSNPPPYANIIFLDLNLPVRNGYEVLTDLRKLENAKNLPVIMFSTSNDANSIQITKRLGAKLYVQKPTSFRSLKAILKNILLIDWNSFSTSENYFVCEADDLVKLS